MVDSVRILGSRLSEVIGMDQAVNRAILSVLLMREIDRGADPRQLSEEIHSVLDLYLVPGTPMDLTEVDREHARDLADRILALARFANRKER